MRRGEIHTICGAGPRHRHLGLVATIRDDAVGVIWNSTVYLDGDGLEKHDVPRKELLAEVASGRWGEVALPIGLR